MMKKILFLLIIVSSLLATACEKSGTDTTGGIPSTMPRTDVPAALRGGWMYGNFSMTEYWSQNPSEYLGNALQFAIAFQFNADGTYTQYFTSSSVMAGVRTYQQSVTIGTVEIDQATKTIKTHPYSAHYKRTQNNQVVEERDLSKTEVSGVTLYTYTTAVEPSGTKSLLLKLQGTTDPLTFLQRQ